MFIKLPVFWADEDYEEKENLGVDPNYSLDYIVINTDYVIEYHPHDNGQTMISLLNGNTYRCPIAFSEFAEKYPAFLAQIELIVESGEIQN